MFNDLFALFQVINNILKANCIFRILHTVFNPHRKRQKGCLVDYLTVYLSAILCVCQFLCQYVYSFICLSSYLSICMYFHLPVSHLCVLSIQLFVTKEFSKFIYLSVYKYFWMSNCLKSISPSDCLSICITFCLFIHMKPSVCLSSCLSICFFKYLSVFSTLKNCKFVMEANKSQKLQLSASFHNR